MENVQFSGIWGGVFTTYNILLRIALIKVLEQFRTGRRKVQHALK